MKLRTIKTKKLPKGVRSITILKATESATPGGDLGRIEVKRKRKGKKQSKGLIRVLERAARANARRNAKSATAYLGRHRRSNKKRRDGWLRDFAYNTMRANRTGGKAIKLSKLIDW